MNRLLVLSATIVLASVSQAAATFQFITNNPVASGLEENTIAGKLSFLNTTYDDGASMLTWDVIFSDGTAKDTDGFWLVVGPGPLPSGSQHQFAIMYFDATTLANPKVLIYRYNGSDFEDSYLLLNDLIASSLSGGQMTIQNVSASENAGARRFSFKVNTGAINAIFGPPAFPDWQGIQFGEKIGIWMHPFAGATTTYSGNRFSLNPQGLVFGPTGWYDGGNITTPAPAAALFAVPLALFAARRRR